MAFAFMQRPLFWKVLAVASTHINPHRISQMRIRSKEALQSNTDALSLQQKGSGSRHKKAPGWGLFGALTGRGPSEQPGHQEHRELPERQARQEQPGHQEHQP